MVFLNIPNRGHDAVAVGVFLVNAIAVQLYGPAGAVPAGKLAICEVSDQISDAVNRDGIRQVIYCFFFCFHRSDKP